MALDEEKIKKQAKAIMDEFARALDKAGGTSGEAGFEREQTTRAGQISTPDKDFRERMLKNAPKKDSSHVIAEKKSW